MANEPTPSNLDEIRQLRGLDKTIAIINYRKSVEIARREDRIRLKSTQDMAYAKRNPEKIAKIKKRYNQKKRGKNDCLSKS